MAKLRDVMLYLCQHYPHKHELSKARLTKMVYLADWKSVLEDGRPMTDIEWTYNHYGPFVDDIYQVAKADPAFEISDGHNLYGNQKVTISVKNPNTPALLTPNEKKWLNHVIENTKALRYDDFIKLVYSTYPVASSPRYSTLNLIAAAERYKATL